MESTFLPQAIKEFLSVVEAPPPATTTTTTTTTTILKYLERFLEVLIDLLSQLPTRRFLRAVVADHHVVVRCKLSTYYTGSSGRTTTATTTLLFSQLLDSLSFYQAYEINDHTGVPLTLQDLATQHYTKVGRNRIRKEVFLEQL